MNATCNIMNLPTSSD